MKNIIVITPLFEGQVNERFQFTLNIEGQDYRGIFHDQKVQGFQPQPNEKLEKEHFNFAVSNVRHFP